MKILATTLILLCSACVVHAQTPNTNGVLYLTSRSNLLTISNVVTIASGLHVGMSGADVQSYLQRHGMTQTNVYSVSLDRGRTLAYPYPLDIETALMLELHCTTASSDRWNWSNPVLDRAYIESHNTNIISITFTNALEQVAPRNPR